MLRFALIIIVVLFSATAARAESVYVKYRGQVDLAPFECTDVMRSSLVKRVCFDSIKEYMLISLNGIYYHYCGIDGGTVSNLLSADSIGRFYNEVIKGSFDCRLVGVPE